VTLRAGGHPAAVTNLLDGRGEGPVHDAATVVLLRQVGGRMECLMLRKTQGQTFAGLWVFPGGRVEPSDGRGLEGARRAAVREAAEETGLVIGADDLVPLSHWTPPVNAPRRYRTWFFLAELPDGASEVVVDGGEIGDHVWTSPSAALATHSRGEIDLLPPTWVTLHRLADQPDVMAALADAAAHPVERFSTSITRSSDGVLVALWEPDAAYPSGGDTDEPVDLDTAGARHRLVMAEGGWHYQRSDD
jgi:8-oxo-dGTP pyrophosphatase MutT (NUDIX family)